MKASSFFVSTLKEAPADAEVVSQQLMLRAGLIKRLSAGIYSYMPMGLRVLRKVEAIIREEMNRAGAVELLMPVIQPAELWQESGRWQKYGPELMRVKDRHDRDFIVQPTSEEVITDIARQELRSYRALPKNFYHIQTKFRDERRPRFGVMRGREFTMKDAYSFDRDIDAAGRSYDRMYAAYVRIFERMGLRFRAVVADNGSIGGVRSHEFQVLADTGEDAILYCPTSDYAANVEMAEAMPLIDDRAAPRQPLARTPTPGKSTCEDVATLLGMPLASTVKSLVLATDARNDAGDVTGTTVWLLLVRGDHSLNEVKAGKLPGLKDGWRFATVGEIDDHFGCKPGYLGPIKTAKPVKLIVDRTVERMSDFTCGANEADFHYTGVNWGRDLPEPDLVADIRNAVAGDPSPDGQGVLAALRGIEVGHVFLLGSFYSAKMNATYLDDAGKPQLLQMGCYGIGVTRVAGAAIEQNHDAKGIAWPAAIAPFAVVICPIGMDRSEAVRSAAQALHDELEATGIDVILDDRGERPGAMFADWELIGVPQRVVISDRGLKEGSAELQGRRDAEPTRLPLAEVPARLRERLAPAEVNTVPAAARSTTIDTLRVLALLGVVVVNASGYAAFPDSGHIVPPPQPADSVVAASVQWLVMATLEGKAYPLLAFLFGVGFAASLRSRGRSGLAHRRMRMRKLLLLGLAHGLLLYAGDVLTIYAVCGFLLLRWASLPTSRLVAKLPWWVAFAAIGVAAQVGLTYAIGRAGASAPLQMFSIVTDWAQFLRLNATRFTATAIGWPVILPQIVLLMLAGFIAGRLRLLTHRRWRERARRLAAWALPAGLLGNGVLAWVVLQPGAGIEAPPHSLSPLFGVIGPVLSAGMAAAIVSRPGTAAALAPAGRLTLSMYLGASLLMALTLSGSGLGWRLGSAATLGYALALYALLLSAAWLAARAGWRGGFERWLSR